MSFELPDPFIELPPGAVDDRLLRDTFEAIQRNLAALAAGLGNFDAAGGVLRVIGTGGRKVAFGGGVVTFTASTNSDTPAFNHGLGVTPVSAVATCSGSGGFFFQVFGFTATQFSAQGFAPFGALTGNVSFKWIAIG